MPILLIVGLKLCQILVIIVILFFFGGFLEANYINQPYIGAAIIMLIFHKGFNK